MRELAILSVERYGEQLFLVHPVDAREYGVKIPTPEFYAELLGALAFFESNFEPNATYVEGFKDKKGVPVVSRGLLQLSFESCNGYGAALTREEDLHHSDINLRCAVLIMSRWIYGDGKISGGSKKAWEGMARYWSPFRKPEKVKQIRDKMKAIFQTKELSK